MPNTCPKRTDKPAYANKVCIRVPKWEVERWKKAAAVEGTTVTAWLRELARVAIFES